MISQERLKNARILVTQVLAGQINPQTEPILFEEDIVLINVRTVEKYDPTWLLTQLADLNYPLSGRQEVLDNMRDLYDAGKAIINPIAADR